MTRSFIHLFLISISLHSFGQSYILPLKYSADGHYFVDQNDKPFPVLGKNATMMVSAPANRYKSFIGQTIAQGYNSIGISLSDNENIDRLDLLIKLCLAKNIVIFLVGTEANRYKDYKNVVLMENSNAYADCPVKPAISHKEPWTGWLNSIGGCITDSFDVKGIKKFIQSYPWWQLIPSGLQGMKKLISSDNSNEIAAACTPNRDLLIAYVPRNFNGSFKVDMSAMSGFTTARWYDPSIAQYTKTSDTHGVFTTPDISKAWVLVIQSKASFTSNLRIVKPLKVSANPNYFQDESGKPIILCGSQTWNSLQDWGSNGSPQPLNFDSFVSFLQQHGHNMTLLWSTELPKFHDLPTAATHPPDLTVTPFPYMRTGPGKASDGGLKFDLHKFNQAYFDRLRERVQKLNEAGIYAGVYLFSGEWLLRFRSSTDGYPFTGGNNINNIDDGYKKDSSATAVASITMNKENEITRIQDEYVKKLINTLNDLPNVLWIVSQEAPKTSAWWNERLIDFVRDYEKKKPLQHPIGLGGYDNSLGDSSIYYNNADWVAPWSRVSPARSCGTGTPACKVNINDSDHSYWEIWLESPEKNRNYVWENFVNGNQVLFMDPYVLHYSRQSRNNFAHSVNNISNVPNPRWDNVRDNMGYILKYSRRMDLANVLPHHELSSTRQCLAQTPPKGAEYLIYAPTGGSFTVDLSAMNAQRKLSVEWFNPATGLTTIAAPVAAGSAAEEFTPPFCGDAVLYLVDEQGHL